MNNGSAILAAFLTTVFFCLCLLTVQHHEMWRDELHSWLIARDSDSLGELIFNKRHEGHPSAWYLCLYGITRFTQQPRAMQIFHLLLAAGSIYLFVRFAPFTKLERILFIFGYYPFFEYAVLSRNYAAGILCIMAFCVLFRRREKNHLVLSLLLFALMQTSFHGLVIALLLGAMLIYLRLFRRPEEADRAAYRRQTLVDGAVLIIGLVVCLAIMIPPPDCGIYAGGHAKFELKRIFRVGALIWKSYIPIPCFSPDFWNTNFLDSHRFLQLSLGFLLFFYFMAVFVRRLPLLLIYITGSAAYLLFHYVKFYGYSRHHGHLFWLLLVCLWLSNYLEDRRRPLEPPAILSGWRRKSLAMILPAILVANLFAGLFAVAMDWRHPFTASQETIKYIKDNNLDEMLIAGDIDDAALALPLYLEREIYYPRSDRFGTFVTYDRDVRWREYRFRDILKRIERLMRERKQDVLIVLNYRLEDAIFNSWNSKRKQAAGGAETYPSRIVKLAEFRNSIVGDERYTLYIMKYSQ